MNIQSAMYSGLQGFQRASAGVTDATLDINRQTQTSQQARQDAASQQDDTAQAAAQPATNTVTQQNNQPAALTDSLVRLNAEERNAQANARTIQTADQVLGSVIDIRV